ncbi:hypothetical protein THASP1DRAFT_18449, partial [Thamnocephalis sphaerospora]
RIDHWNFYKQLLAALGEMPQLPEKHSRDIVPFFLPSKCAILVHTARVTHERMAGFLRLFGKIRNPRQFYKTAELHSIYWTLLSKGDQKIQGLALDCLLTWRPKNVLIYADNLRNLLDDYKFRDELVTFSLTPGEEGAINAEHRPDVLPYVVRILYGRMVSRKGRGSAKTGMTARRTAILSALGGFQEAELGMFVDLMLEPFARIRMADDMVDGVLKMSDDASLLSGVSRRRQLGLLNALEDVLKQLGARLAPYITTLFRTVLYLAREAHVRLAAADTNTLMEVDSDDTQQQDDSTLDTFAREQYKQIRQQSHRRLCDFFRMNVIADYRSFMPAMFAAFASERVEKLDVESTQAPSAIMEMFVAWSCTYDYATYLVDYEPRIIPKLFACLSAKKVRPSVVSEVLSVVENLLSLQDPDAMALDENAEEHRLPEANAPVCELSTRILGPHVPLLLNQLSGLLFATKHNADFARDAFVRREINVLSRVAQLVEGEHQVQQVVELLMPYLKKPGRQVPESTKVDILRIVSGFLRMISELRTRPGVLQRYYGEFSALFQKLSSRDCRLLLVSVLDQLALINSDIQLAADLARELNAFTGRRIGEPDFDRRLAAFGRINDELYLTLTPLQWLPLLHNFVFFMHDTEELSIRGSAAYGLKRFVERAANEPADTPDRAALENLLVRIVYAGVKRAMKTRAEVVRQEAAMVLATIVQRFAHMPLFSDMARLLADGDEEASFLHNVYHIQLHRRIRAVQRLGQMCTDGKLTATTLTQLILPMLDHFIFDADRVADHNLINATVVAVGAAAECIPWGAYHNQLRKFLRAFKSKPDLEKVMVRALMTTIDAFHFDLSAAEVADQTPPAKRLPEPFEQKVAEVAPVEENEAANTSAATSADMVVDTATRIHAVLTSRLLPELMTFVRPSDEENVRTRVPIALSLAKLLRKLPEKSLRIQLPGLLVILCQSLRYKTQDARDCTRDTLNKIAAFLGPSYLQFLVVELRTALTRGFQRHVLGYTLHSLLANLQPQLRLGDLENCLDQLIAVMIEDIFGSIGEEKEKDEVTGKTKEMRAMRSYDSYEIVTRLVRYESIDKLIVPLKDIMHETESLKVMRKVDEVLRRLAVGINYNPDFKAQQLYLFCYGMISLDAKIALAKPVVRANKSLRDLNYEVQLQRDHGEKRDYYQTNVHRFVEFGLGILLTAFKRTRFDTQCKEHLGWLNKLLDVTGNAAYSHHQQVMVLAFRALSVLCPLPLHGLKNGLPAVVKRTFEVLSKTTNTGTELAQSCFRLLTCVIRQCQQVTVTEAQLTFLVNLIRPDLEETEKQAVTFSLVRAIIGRKFVAPEVYDLMDTVRDLLVTSQSDQVRAQCRQIYLQFLLEYPQGEKRMVAQLRFLVSNLGYVYESGRESVMELLSVVFTKIDERILAPHWEMFLMALVLALVNDESSRCREMVGSLIRTLFKTANQSARENFFVMLSRWFENGEHASMRRASLQAYGLVIEASGDGARRHLPKLLGYVKTVLAAAAKEVHGDADSEEEEEEASVAEHWEQVYFALSTFARAIKHFADITYTAATLDVWRHTFALLLYPHTWVRLSSARLLGQYLGGLDASTLAVAQQPDAPVFITTATLNELTVDMCRQLKSPLLADELGTQVVKNLFFIGRHLFAHDKTATADDAAADSDAESASDEEEGKEKPVSHKSGKLLRLFKRLSYTARKEAGRTQRVAQVSQAASVADCIAQLMSIVSCQRMAIYRWFAAMVSFIPGDELQPYLVPIISPVYRTVADETNKTEEFEPLRQLASELLEMVQKHVGSTVYFEAYTGIRKHAEEKRTERKSKRAFQAMVDPEAHAKRKLRKNEKKKELQKRKVAKDMARKGKVPGATRIRVSHKI